MGIYQGKEKPASVNEFLETFISEVTNLINMGVNIKDIIM